MRYFYGFYFILSFTFVSGIAEANTRRFTGKITCVDQVEGLGREGVVDTVRVMLWPRVKKRSEGIIADINRDMLKSAGIKLEVGSIFNYTTVVRKPGLQIYISPRKPKKISALALKRLEREVERELPKGDW